MKPDNGKEDTVKETREGCLSRLIKINLAQPGWRFLLQSNKKRGLIFISPQNRVVG